MYPEGFATYVVQEGLTGVLEGASRPTHFRGVLTVVCKLFHAVPAERAYFGRKDFQQTVVVRRMVRDLGMPVEVRVMPTVREADGLAMSSRNAYLNADERRQATCLHGALTEARRLYGDGETEAEALRQAMRRTIAAAPLARPDYVEVVDEEYTGPAADGERQRRGRPGRPARRHAPDRQLPLGEGQRLNHEAHEGHEEHGTSNHDDTTSTTNGSRAG